jgi:hypothetical protein
LAPCNIPDGTTYERNTILQELGEDLLVWKETKLYPNRALQAIIKMIMVAQEQQEKEQQEQQQEEPNNNNKNNNKAILQMSLVAQQEQDEQEEDQQEVENQEKETHDNTYKATLTLLPDVYCCPIKLPDVY